MGFPGMKTPLITVVMSVWNARDTLARAVDSILGQTYSDFEFLIVDDGSTDGSDEMLAEYARGDARVRILGQKNSGLTRALIRGCAEARGEWIARQDADDWSEPQRLEKCLALAERHPECVMVSSWTDYRGPGGEVLDEIRRPENCEEATHGLLHCGLGPPAHGSVLFDKMAYAKAGGYREEFYFGQDSDLWLRLAGIGKVGYVPEVLYHYTLSAEAISGRFGELQKRFGELGQLCHAARMRGESEEVFLTEAAALVVGDGIHEKAGSSRARAGLNYRIGVRLARRRNPAAVRYFREAWKQDPFHWRACLRLIFHTLRG